MEPRELWGRHAVLAEAFCAGDERVREAQARLDEAQADRLRVLAAFAVTVGSTGAVADLFGLNEREVRVARRTVGKEDAKAVAEELLATAAARSAASAATAAEAAQDADTAPGGGSESAGESAPAASGVSGAASGEPAGNFAGNFAGNSAAVDAVLIGSWQTGVDLRELATEFGLDLTRLVTRAQQLSAQGRLPSGPAPAQEGYGGRHRRGGVSEVREPECSIPAQQSAGWAPASSAQHSAGWGAVSSAQTMPSAWYPASASSPAEAVTEVTTLPADWDQALAAWGQFGPPYEEPAPAHVAPQPWAQYQYHLSS